MRQRLEEAKVQLGKLLKLNPNHSDGRTLKAVIDVLESSGIESD
jgi:hypothetical protein